MTKFEIFMIIAMIIIAFTQIGTVIYLGTITDRLEKNKKQNEKND